jgi:AcrR family transcriptional regulator
VDTTATDLRRDDELTATGRRIRDAVIDLFRTRGFHAATMREIAQKVGIESATIYYHFENKEALLYHVMRVTRDDLIASAEAILARGGDPSQRLQRFVANHAEFHAARTAEAAITATELHSLSPEWRERIITGRDAYEAMLRRILAEGDADGSFDVDDAGLLARAILTMCTSVALWYRPTGQLSPEEIGERFAAFALKMARREVSETEPPR